MKNLEFMKMESTNGGNVICDVIDVATGACAAYGVSVYWLAIIPGVGAIGKACVAAAIGSIACRLGS